VTGGPIGDLLAVAMVGVASFHAGRLGLAVLWRRVTQVDVDVVHTAMGVSMAGMLTGWLTGAWNDVWMVAFAASTVWFGRGLVRRLSDSRAAGPAIAHHLPHFVASAVMLYMLWAMRWMSMTGRQPGSTGSTAMGSMGHVGGGGLLLPAVLAALVVGNAAMAAWLGLSPSLGVAGVEAAAEVALGAAAPGAAAVRQASGGSPAPRSSRTPRPVGVLGSRGAPACLLAMSVAMAYMVVAVHP
jgi:hypothetical protein